MKVLAVSCNEDFLQFDESFSEFFLIESESQLKKKTSELYSADLN